MRRTFLMLSLVMLPAPTVLADDQKPPSVPVELKAADGDAPLPQGFPEATKPGKIEVKTYPAYRSAVAKVEKATMTSSNMMFFSLFNHIQRKNVEMTAPVINTFKTPGMVETPGAQGEATMEFLYRTPTQGETGADGSLVKVEDHPAQQFVCIGFQGDMNDKGTREGLEQLRKWLKEHSGEWVEDGPPRRLGYHGPMTPAAKRWWEVQMPVKPVAAARSTPEK